jgi:hypothetical protein
LWKTSEDYDGRILRTKHVTIGLLLLYDDDDHHHHHDGDDNDDDDNDVKC